MATIAYVSKNFSVERLRIIARANAICEEYQAQGLSLTLRQLYYQFVARDFLPNKQTEYKRLGDILNDARMAGQMDWEYLVDRTRNLVDLAHWSSPAEIIQAVASSYRTDRWADQHQRIEVWIEKDAGIGVIERVCQTNDVPYFSCRGYTSVSEIWAAAQRLGRYIEEESAPVTILHIGDHDPSGLDMSRDIEDRLKRFIVTDWAHGRMENEDYVYEENIYADDEALYSLREHLNDEEPLTVRRIALNYNQVQQYNPPPNPAKTTDARFQKYVRETGLRESWELDALDPSVLAALIQVNIDSIRNTQTWSDSTEAMEVEKRLLRQVSRNWSEVREFASGL